MRLEPFESSEHRCGDNVVTYSAFGNPESSRTIVFCNGLFHGHQAWHGILQDRALRGGWRLLVTDYRGCGPGGVDLGVEFRLQDVARDVLETAKSRGGVVDAVVGHSIGTQVALWMAILEPRTVPRLALLSGSVRLEAHSRALVRGALDLLVSGAEPRKVFAVVYPWFFSAEYLEKLQDLREEFIGSYVSYNRNAGAIVRFLDAVTHGIDLRERLGEIQAEVLVVSGEEDRIFPPRCQVELASLLPSSRLVQFPGCGHSAITERARELRMLLGELLNSPISRAA